MKLATCIEKTLVRTFLCAIIIIAGYLISSYIYNYYYSKILILTPHNVPSTEVCYDSKLVDLKKSTVKILIIDGGGIKGIIPLTLLHYVEKKTGKPISETFDFFAGTSTGAIIVTTLNVPDKNNNPLYSVNDVINAYVLLSKSAMTPSLSRMIFTLNGLLGPRFSIAVLHDAFVKKMGNHRLSLSIKKVAITSYNLNKKALQLFKSWDCMAPYSSYPASYLLSAATAIPTIYSPVMLDGESFMDGYVVANNPTLSAIRDVVELYPHAKKYIFVHLGAGSDPLDHLTFGGEITEKWGLLHWLYPAALVYYSSQDSSVKEAIHDMKLLIPNTKFSYYYFNTNIVGGNPTDPSESNVNIIKMIAEQLIKEQQSRMGRLIKELEMHDDM